MLIIYNCSIRIKYMVSQSSDPALKKARSEFGNLPVNHVLRYFLDSSGNKSLNNKCVTGVAILT